MNHHHYKNILNHMEGHDLGCKLKKWLLELCQREDANTIRKAVQSISANQLMRRLARALAED